ncbi:OmpA family protein [Gemmatimonas sp.]|uniref:OmpA family protein n=1 Tax=Gemmatimonas sp. TaxID=1962908 RepID=UPI00286AF8AB|nr:OmpA family protein [Gemmatimonas sp.]
MRTLHKFIIGATLSVALPASAFAQRQGAIELGAFGRVTKFADTLKLDTGLGLGGRAGIYAFKNWLLEMELSYADVDVNLPRSGDVSRDTLNKVSHALWAYRLTYNHPLSDRLKLLAGAGYAYDSYGRVRIVAPRGGGPQGLLGLRYVINDRLSARFEGTGTYVLPADDDAKPVARAAAFNLGAQAGLSLSFFTRDPKPRVQYDTVRVSQRDTVYVNRIDTVRIAGPAARPIVIGAINFAFNKSDISNEAKTILDIIAASLVEPTNSSRTITVTGNTDAIGSERYNETLGQARADQAKAYLVSKGVAESRVVARTQGEKDPVAPNTTDNGRATNRRVLVMLTN